MVNIVPCENEKEQRNSLKTIVKNYIELKGMDCAFREFDSGESLLSSPLTNEYVERRYL